MVCLGIDLGGTKTALGFVGENGVISSRTSFPTIPNNFDAYYQKLEEQIIAFLKFCGFAPEKLTTIGVGSAGQIELESGRILFSPNLNWQNAPLGQKLKQSFPNCIVTVDNDVRAATLGEYLFGFDKRPSSYINIFLGTGIGSGIIINNRMLRGFSNSAGELGQTSIKYDGPKAPNGNYGVYEYYASGTGLTRLAREMNQENPDCFGESIISDQQITGQFIAEKATQGNTNAIELIQKVGFFVGVGISNVINLLNPEVITYGGGLAQVGSLLTDAMIQTAQERSIPSAFAKTLIQPAKYGSDAGISGAAFLHLIDSDGNIID